MTTRPRPVTVVLLALTAACVSLFARSSFAQRPTADDSDTARRVDEVTHPFNGRNLEGFTTWCKETGPRDPRRVYSVVDGTIRVSGEGRGYLATVESYRDYHLQVEYKWGERTDGSKYVRNSGILLHGTGPDGSAGGTWQTSIEVQLAQGCEGDLIVIRGTDRQDKTFPATITSDTIIAADNRTRWRQEGEKTVYSGRQFWWSGHQVGFEELLDTRGRDDVASPLGQWTKVECVCAGDRIRVIINGVTVNECYDVHPSQGRILLQNEGHEIYFRNFTLKPLREGGVKP
jgi:3-keto-disaccharide hydrolase